RVEIVRHRQELEVTLGDHAACESLCADPGQQLVPVIAAEQDDRKVEHLAGLNQGQGLEELVCRTEAAGEDDEALGRLHEHRLPDVEVMERQREIEIGIRL